MKLNLKIRSRLELIEGELWELRKLSRTQRGFLLTIPKMWIEIFCTPDKDGNYWIGFELDEDTIRLKGYQGGEDVSDTGD